MKMMSFSELDYEDNVEGMNVNIFR